MLFARLLTSLIRFGTLTVIDARNRTHRFEGRPIADLPAGEAPPPVTIRLHDPALHWQLATNPTVRLGEAYMDGTVTVEEGDIADLLRLAVYNMNAIGGHPVLRFQDNLNRALRWAHQYNPWRRAQKNVAHHYDLSGELYDLFLDADRQYSCAYFPTGRETLEEAQEAKKRHIAAKMLLKPGQRVLDIGCGWGGMGLFLARTFDVAVEGITLSREQLALARERARDSGLSTKVDFSLKDYRFMEGRFDRIVSVGMFEHVGVRHYGEFFRKARDLLADDGVFLLHTIGRTTPPGGTNKWIRKYIFPGGYTPALSEVMAAIQRTGLIVTDIEVLRVHYAHTLRHWRERFLANRDKAEKLYDARFCRMWEFYLAGCEAVFRHGDQVVFQLQIAKRRDTVPQTRDYIHDFEHGRPATADGARRAAE